MDFIIIHHETGLLICKDCKFALILSRINTYFKDSPYRLKPLDRTLIENYISYIDNLVIGDHEIKSKIRIFLKSFNQTSSIPELALYLDKLAYSYCSYISRSRRPI